MDCPDTGGRGRKLRLGAGETPAISTILALRRNELRQDNRPQIPGVNLFAGVRKFARWQQGKTADRLGKANATPPSPPALTTGVSFRL